MNDAVIKEKGKVDLLDALTAILGQIPTGSVAIGYGRFSIYQPAFYRGKEIFLLIPLFVGLFATWIVMKDHRAMFGIFVIGIAVGIANFCIFEFVSLQSEVHTVNWILSYCAFALLVAAAMRFIGELVGLRTRS